MRARSGALARRLEGRARGTWHRIRRASVVLLYHRVADGPSDPWSLCVRPAHFREQMAVLARRRVVPLDALAGDVDAGRRRRSIVVTFDDGYADFAAAALPILRTLGIPATLFVASGILDDQAEFWWDELERIVLAGPLPPERLELAIGGARFAWFAPRDGDRRALYLALHRALGRVDGATRAAALRDLRAWARVGAARRESHRPLRADEVAPVARDPLVRVGAHSVSHAYLTALADAAQRAEIVDSKRRLEAIVARPVDHFSYPHGDHAPATVAHVRAAGFRVACDTVAAPVTAGADVLALPRVEVPDLAGPAFARWLAQWGG